MADMCLYNGVVLPEPPSNAYGEKVIYRKDGTYHLISADWTGIYLFGIHPTENVLHHRVSVYHFMLENGQWIKSSESVPKDTAICPKEDLVWCEEDIHYQPYDISSTFQVKDLYMAGSNPVLLSKGNFDLEPIPGSSVVVSSWGNTGVTIGAQLRGNGGEVIDVSANVSYTFFGATPVNAYRDAGGQLVVDQEYPLDEIIVFITYEGFQTRIYVFNAGADSGGGGSGGESGETSTITGITASETVLELSPGASYPLTVTVDGTGDYDPTVLYHIFENENGIYWDGNTIHVGEDASLIDCYIAFYSQQDPSYNIGVVVTVKALEKPCYLKENGVWVKKTAYERINGEWVKISDASDVPLDYEFVEYLHSNGNSYFSTDIIPNAETEVEMKYSAQELLTLGTHMLSCENWYCPFPRKSIFLANRNGNELEITPAPVVNTIYTVRTYLDGTISINGVDYGPLTAGTKNPTKPLYMCTYGGNPGSSNYAGECRVYYCKIWQAGELVRDYIPVVNRSGVAGMYDKVTKTFYGSIGEDFEASA